MRSLTTLLLGAALAAACRAQTPETLDHRGNRAALPAAHESHVSAPGGEIAGPGDWAALGPFGGDVADVAASPQNPNIVLAGLAPSGGAGGTLYRSADGGANWLSVNQLTGRSVYSIAFAPDGAAYIGTQDGVWKSVDGGASWTQLALNIGLNDAVLAIAIDPANPSRIFAGVDDALGSQTANIMRSPDGGQTWFDVSAQIPAIGCRGIAFKPGDAQVIYACFAGAFGGGQLWVSTTGGDTWVNRSAGLPNFPLNDVAHDGARLLVCGGQAFGSQFVGLYASTNDGQQYTPLHAANWPTLVVNDIELAAGNPQQIRLATIQGVFQSEDGGASWLFGAGSSSALSLNAMRSDSATGVTFVGGAASAVWRSAAGGAFAPSSTGIGALNVVSAASNPRDNRELAIAFQGLNNGGVYRSTDRGQMWTLQNLPGTRYSAVRFAPDGTLYAISSGPTSVAPEGLYRRNADASWTLLGPDQGTLFESDLVGMRFSRNDPGLILLVGADFGVAGSEATIWRSLFGGTDWTKVYEGPATFEKVTDLEIVEDGSDQVMVASFIDSGTNPQTGGALRSTTRGASWLPASVGLDAETQGAGLSTSPISPTTFYLADDDSGANVGGVFRSVDAGLNWTRTGFVGAVRDVLAEPTDPSVLYAMRGNAERVVRSVDAGATFQPFNVGLASAGNVRALTYSPGACTSLLLSTTTGAYLRDLEIHTAGDVNCDCRITFFDIDAFLLAVFDAPAYAAAFPDCPIETADLDGSGLVNFFDIDPFVACLFGDCPPLP